MAIEISLPEILQGINGKTRLSTRVSFPDEKKELFFEIKEEWAAYLVTDRLDAFVLILLPYAMKTGQDIVCHAPVSIELFEKISDSLIPTLSRFTKRYKKIRIWAEVTKEKVASESLCAAGFSGGLDSMYTVYTLKDRIPDFKILATFDAGVYEHHNHLNELDEAIKLTSDFAKHIGMKCIGLSCNITDLVDEHYRSVLCFRIFACALALGKAWNRYIFSSGSILMQKEITEEAAESALAIFLYSCSTHYLRFEQFGAYSSRPVKARALSEAPTIFRDTIHVCLRDYVFGHCNCCYCAKCASFLVMVEANGILEPFSKAFPIEEYEKNKKRIMVSQHFFQKRKVMGKIVFSQEDATGIEKSEKQADAIKSVIEKRKEKLAEKVRENGLV